MYYCITFSFWNRARTPFTCFFDNFLSLSISFLKGSNSLKSAIPSVSFSSCRMPFSTSLAVYISNLISEMSNSTLLILASISLVRSSFLALPSFFLRFYIYFFSRAISLCPFSNSLFIAIIAVGSSFFSSLPSSACFFFKENFFLLSCSVNEELILISYFLRSSFLEFSLLSL